MLHLCFLEFPSNQVELIIVVVFEKSSAGVQQQRLILETLLSEQPGWFNFLHFLHELESLLSLQHDVLILQH